MNQFESHLGAFTQNSGSLIFRGGEVRTYKDIVDGHVCSVNMYYRLYSSNLSPGAFQIITLPLNADCNAGTQQYPGGAECQVGDQRWSRVIADGQTIPQSPLDLTNNAPGNYVLEVYYEIQGNSSGGSGCEETVLVNNSGQNFKASFFIQSPTLASANPTTCNGNEGFITINGLSPGTVYSVSYMDDDVSQGPLTLTANSSGQVVINGLNAGFYSDFIVAANNCETELSIGLTLSNNIITPRFNSFGPYCAGSKPSALPSTSNNGITGTWSPGIINDQASGAYTFTPNANQCARQVTINIVITQNVTPEFSFGTSLTICEGGTVPVLPNTSLNAITGVWSPAIVDNQNSGVYTFTPNEGQCATSTQFAVNVRPNITPVFTFGSSLQICEGASVPALPPTSLNDLNGSWNPSTIDNQASGVYTFTPAGEPCALSFVLTVDVSPNVQPTFSFGTTLNICSGGIVPDLPNTSENGIEGSWNPAVVDIQSSGSYTFNPSEAQCALPFVFNVTVTPLENPAFSFGTTLSICAGQPVPALVNQSLNSITGTWSPATINNDLSGTYTFTPDEGQCATNTTLNVTVQQNITPLFDFGSSLEICAGQPVPSLPSTSQNGINGTWSPAQVSNQASGEYVFTPSNDQCATAFTLNVIVQSIQVPVFSFSNSITICEGDAVPVLPEVSQNGITGQWSQQIINNSAPGTYTFTPDAGQCAEEFTLSVTVTNKNIPVFEFGTALVICEGGDVPVLPAAAMNGISGTWSPAIADNMQSASYTFTPEAGICASPVDFTITVNPNVTPEFSIGTSLSFCTGVSVPTLPSASDNGIQGSWSPAAISNQQSGNYVFTPAEGQCTSQGWALTVTIAENINSVFNFGNEMEICREGSVPVLPDVSTNGITGSWAPSIVDNQNSDTYTFTPDAGQCALPFLFAVRINNPVIPAFTFGTAFIICSGASVPALPSASENGISGSWTPAAIDNENSGTYTFTPGDGQCAVSTTLDITVRANLTPEFLFESSMMICEGDIVPSLPSISDNGIEGIWSPATISNIESGVYTFSPAEGACADGNFQLTITVQPYVHPLFSFGSDLTICEGGEVPLLPIESENGITGTWNISAIDNMESGIYIFTPDVPEGYCISKFTLTVTVKKILAPQFTFGTSQTICLGASVPLLPQVSENGINGFWNFAVIDNMASATYTFTSAEGECALPTATFDVIVNPIPAILGEKADTTVNDGAVVAAFQPNASPVGTTFTWTNSNPSIGLQASGTGVIPSFTAVNTGTSNVTSTITITPVLNNCLGSSISYKITVLPSSKDIFIPNVFSPNGDGKNDVLMVYGNNIVNLTMRIYNQWGEQVEVITSITRGWDGKYKGKEQPSGVYTYVAEVNLKDGRRVHKKGFVNLVR